jgi:hypothetical protein
MRIASFAPALALAACLAGCSGDNSTTPSLSASPFQFVQPAGVFYKDYTGPQRPAIDAIAAGGKYSASAQTIVLDARMAGPVLTGGPNYFVWGFDRGGATNAPFPDEPNVKFNAVVVVTADPATGAVTGTVNALNGQPAQPVTVILTAPDTLEVTVAAAQLPSTGLAPSAYLWNLWPRSGVGGSPTAQIASFIPENAMGPLVAVP